MVCILRGTEAWFFFSSALFFWWSRTFATEPARASQKMVFDRGFFLLFGVLSLEAHFLLGLPQLLDVSSVLEVPWYAKARPVESYTWFSNRMSLLRTPKIRLAGYLASEPHSKSHSPMHTVLNSRSSCLLLEAHSDSCIRINTGVIRVLTWGQQRIQTDDNAMCTPLQRFMCADTLTQPNNA